VRRLLTGAAISLLAAAPAAHGQDGFGVSITEGPVGAVEATGATFAFLATRPASFVCRLDERRPAPCTSPVTYGDLPVGDHAFMVTATHRDRAGDEVSASDVRRWTVVAPAGEPGRPPPAGPDRGGAPRDGDLCPGTPARLEAAWRGCAAVELPGSAALATEPVVDELRNARALTGRRAGPHVARARSLIAGATRLLASGQPCAARASYGRALRQLSGARRRMNAGYRRRARQVARTRGAAADVTPAQVQLAVRDLERARVSDALADAARAGRAVGAACRAVRGRLRLRGEVIASDDAAGLLRLRDGRVLALHDRTEVVGLITAGVRVAVRGVAMKDGTGLVDSITGAKPGPPPAAKFSGCLALRVAPVQPAEPFVANASTTLHDPWAYRTGTGRVVLERLSRVAVAKVGCPDTTADGKVLFYGATIVERLGVRSETIATDLLPGEAPVWVGQLVEPGKTGKLTVTTHVRACRLLANGVNDCERPVELDTVSTEFGLVPVGSLAEAVYDRTDFTVKGNGVEGDFEAAKVTGIKTVGMASPATGFEATGYAVSGGVSSRPVQTTIEKGEPFAVYADDLFEPGWGSLFVAGTVTPSGLTWPHVVGQRNGKTFWYSARLPAIVRDWLGHHCFSLPGFTLLPPPGDDPPSAPFSVPAPWGGTHYRLPFPSGLRATSGLMNIDDPVAAARHPEGQAFALDLKLSAGTPLLAARGGVIEAIEDDDPYNAASKPAGWQKLGNYIWIRHEDDTLAVYFHNQVHSAKVQKGDHVYRGQPIARVGATGNTGTTAVPHVHFGAFRIVDGKVVPDVRIGYEYLLKADPPFGPQVLTGCGIPRSGEWFYSTNTPTPD
jgi:murein DD-endopeptidase MepM/ murein hydrolase activator NlpD